MRYGDAHSASGAGLPEELQRQLVNWLHRLEGQVRGVAAMIERGEPSDDVLVQLTAAKSSIVQVTTRLLEGHMDDCLAQGDEEAIERLKDSVKLVLKHS